MWKEILQLNQRRYSLYNIAEPEELVLKIHYYLPQSTIIVRYTLPHWILNGTLRLLSYPVNASDRSYPSPKSYYGNRLVFFHEVSKDQFNCCVYVENLSLVADVGHSATEKEEEEDIFIFTEYYLQLELILKAALLKQINITYIHKEKQDSDMRHTIKVLKEILILTYCHVLLTEKKNRITVTKIKKGSK